MGAGASLFHDDVLRQGLQRHTGAGTGRSRGFGMRVLVTADTVGGVWTYTRELVTGLAQRGVEVVLVSFGEIPNAAQSDWLDGLKNVDYRATAFKLEWMQDSLDDLRASSGFLMDVVRETKPSLLHFSQYFYGA